MSVPGNSPPTTPSSSGTPFRELFASPSGPYIDSPARYFSDSNHEVFATGSTDPPERNQRQESRKDRALANLNWSQTAERMGGFFVGGQPDEVKPRRLQSGFPWSVGGVLPNRPTVSVRASSQDDNVGGRAPTLQDVEVSVPSNGGTPQIVPTDPIRLTIDEEEPGMCSPSAEEPADPLDALKFVSGGAPGSRRKYSTRISQIAEYPQSRHVSNNPPDRSLTSPRSGSPTVYDVPQDDVEARCSLRSVDEGAGQVGGRIREGEDFSPHNWWGHVRWKLREPLAEWLGMMVLVLIGVGASCQTKISEGTYGNYTNLMIAWGYAVTLAIYISGGVSGGHVNPVITICLAIFRGFPWRLVPRYIIAQVFGAFCGAAILYSNYSVALETYDPGMTVYGTNASAGLFVTMPSEQVGGARQGCIQEFIASGVLHVVVLALGDENNAPPGAGLGAFITGSTIMALGMSQGWISGYAVNPARDLGPRIFLWFAGYGVIVWHHDGYWWLTGPICSTLAGGIFGCFLYDFAVFGGDSSFVNFPGWRLREATGITKMHRMVTAAVRKSNQETTESRVEKGKAAA